MMGSGSPFEGMPGGIGERNGMIRLPYHPLTSLIRHFDNGQALTLLHSGRGGRYSVLGLHAYHRLMQYGDDVMEGTLAVCGDDDVWRDRLLPGQDALMLLHDRLRDEPGVLGFMSYDDGRRREGARSRFDGGQQAAERKTPPDAAWWSFDDILIEDRQRRSLTLLSHHRHPNSARNIAAIRSVCQSVPAGGAVAKRLGVVIQAPRTPQPPTAAHGAATTIAPHTARPWNDSNRTCTTAKPT